MTEQSKRQAQQSQTTDGPANVAIGEFQANSRETISVSIDEFKGHRLINLRKWGTWDDGQLHPSKAGIACQVKHLPELAALINAALAHARSSGLIAVTD
jgi:hypothetical protein